MFRRRCSLGSVDLVYCYAPLSAGVPLVYRPRTCTVHAIQREPAEAPLHVEILRGVGRRHLVIQDSSIV